MAAGRTPEAQRLHEEKKQQTQLNENILKVIEKNNIALPQKLDKYVAFLDATIMGDRARKEGLKGHILELKTDIQTEPALADHEETKSAIIYISNQVKGLVTKGKLTFSNEMLANYDAARDRVFDDTIEAKEALPFARELKDASFKDFDATMRIDPYLNSIDENIKGDLYTESGSLKTADQIKDIGLDLDIAFLPLDAAIIDNSEISRDALAAYIARLDNNSMQELVDFYGATNEQDAIRQFKEEISESFSEGIQASAKELQEILNTDDLTVSFGGREMKFRSLQERNYALVSTLYFLNGFAKDPEGNQVYYYMLGETISGVVSVLGFGPNLLGDIGRVISGTLLVGMVGYHLLQFSMRTLPKGDQSKNQKAYNMDREGFIKETDSPDFKKRHALLNTIIERVEIESNHPSGSPTTALDSSLLRELKAFQKTHFTVGSTNRFYTKLFKIIYSHEGATKLFQVATKFFVVPGSLGIIEELRGAPNLRGRSHGVGKFFSQFAFDVKGSKAGTVLDFSGSIDGTFQEILEQVEKDAASHNLSHKMGEVFRGLGSLGLGTTEEAKLVADMTQIVQNEGLTDSDAKNKMETQLKEVAQTMKDLLKLSDDPKISEFQAEIVDRVKSLAGRVDIIHIENLEKGLQELSTELEKITGTDTEKGLLAEMKDIKESNISDEIKKQIKEGIQKSDPNNNVIQVISETISEIKKLELLLEKIKNVDPAGELKTELVNSIGKDKTVLDSLEKKLDTYVKIESQYSDINNVSTRDLKEYKTEIDTRLRDALSDINKVGAFLEELSKEVKVLMGESNDGVIKKLSDINNTDVVDRLKAAIKKGIELTDPDNNAIKNISDTMSEIRTITDLLPKVTEIDSSEKLKAEFLDAIGKDKITLKALSEKLEKYSSLDVKYGTLIKTTNNFGADYTKALETRIGTVFADLNKLELAITSLESDFEKLGDGKTDGVISRLSEIGNDKVQRAIEDKIRLAIESGHAEKNTITNIVSTLDKIVKITDKLSRVSEIDPSNSLEAKLLKIIGKNEKIISLFEGEFKSYEDILPKYEDLKNKAARFPVDYQGVFHERMTFVLESQATMAERISQFGDNITSVLGNGGQGGLIDKVEAIQDADIKSQVHEKLKGIIRGDITKIAVIEYITSSIDKVTGLEAKLNELRSFDKKGIIKLEIISAVGTNINWDVLEKHIDTLIDMQKNLEPEYRDVLRLVLEDRGGKDTFVTRGASDWGVLEKIKNHLEDIKEIEENKKYNEAEKESKVKSARNVFIQEIEKEYTTNIDVKGDKLTPTKVDGVKLRVELLLALKGANNSQITDMITREFIKGGGLENFTNRVVAQVKSTTGIDILSQNGKLQTVADIVKTPGFGELLKNTGIEPRKLTTLTKNTTMATLKKALGTEKQVMDFLKRAVKKGLTK